MVVAASSVASPAKGRTGDGNGGSSRREREGRMRRRGILASRGRRDAQQVVYPLQTLFINFPSRCFYLPTPR